MELWQTRNQLKDSSCLSIVGNSFPQAKETDVRNSHHQGSDFCFQYKGKNQCVDATDEVAGESYQGCLVNHSIGKETNARVQVLSIDDTPRLRFFSTRNIKVGEEILYDYGTMKLTWEINMQSGTTSNKDKESALLSDHKGLNLVRASDIEDLEEDMSFHPENTGAVPNMDRHSASTSGHQNLNPERASDVEDSEEEIPFLSRPQNSGDASKEDKESPSTSSHQSLNPDRAGDKEEPDEEIPFVFCPQVQKKSGKRVYNKHQACYYCGKLVTKISKHLLQVHSDEPRVAHISALPPKSNSRVVELELIRNCGNYYHNLEVISKQRGHLILVRRPSLEEFNIDDYRPCPYCLGFYKTCDLYKHCKYFCVAGSIRDSAKDTKDIRLASDTLIGKYSGVTPYLQKAFMSMKNDELRMIARNDPLILEQENSHRRKGSGMDSHERQQYMSQEMRQSMRMLKEMRELGKGGDRYKMEDFLTPGRSYLVAEAVLNVASSSEKRHEEGEDEAIGEPDDDTFDAADDIAHPSDADDAKDIHHLACEEDREEEPTVSDTQTMWSQQKRTSNNSPGSPRKRQRYMTEHLKDSSYCPSDSSDSYGDEPSRHSATRKKHEKQAGCRRTWSRNETEAVWSHLNKFIKSETVPGRDECVKCLNKSEVLESRSWKDVKYKVKNIITAIKRQRGSAKKITYK